MEQLFGARIGARINQLFGARIRDLKGTAFRGPNRGTTFRGPGLLAVDVSLGALWRPPFQSAHLCPFGAQNPGPEWNRPESGPNRTTFRGPGLLAVDVSPGCHCFKCTFVSTSHLFGARMVYDFLGPESGTRMEQLFGARIGARIERDFSTFRPGALGCGCFSRGSLEATVSICTFVSTSHLFGARMVYDFSGPESGTRMEQLFGARIGARIEKLFGARGSWLWMFLHQPSFRGPNGMTFWGPSPVPEW